MYRRVTAYLFIVFAASFFLLLLHSTVLNYRILRSTEESPILMNKTFRIVFYTSEVDLDIKTLNCYFTFQNTFKAISNDTRKISSKNIRNRTIAKKSRRKTNLYETGIEHIVNSVKDFDAVLFHVKDMPGSRMLKFCRNKLEKKMMKTQVWGYYNKESAYNTINLRDGKYDNIFDLVITPLRTSDVQAPYGYYYPKGKISYPKEASEIAPVPFSRKTNLVAWIASHCNEQRDRVVSALLEHIPVHVIGRCQKKYQQYHNCPRQSLSCEMKLRKYKFVLAFENSFCKDYVTEKYWNALYRGNVPIVYGGSNYDESLVIPGSFINVRDFKSFKDLAQFIKKISNNQYEYEKYFRWKDKYVLDYKPNDRHRFEIITKKMCLVLNRRKKFEKYILSKFYGRSENCQYQEILDHKRTVT